VDGGITLCIALALVTLAYLVARIIARCEFGPTEELWLDDYVPGEMGAAARKNTGGMDAASSSGSDDVRTHRGKGYTP